MKLVSLAYRAERLPARLLVPVVAILGLAARADSGIRPFEACALDLLVLLFLFVQFRLWDDLADRAHDAVHHPGRVLVQASSDGGFRRVCAGLGIFNLGILILTYGSPIALATFLALTGVTGLWYGLRRHRSSVGNHVLLLKYPAFVFIVASGRHIERSLLVACATLAIYLAACVYEAVHDPTSPVASNRPLVLGEAVLLFLLLAATVAAAAIGAHS